ncbi:hypothetical protein pEaSNUABM13_00019 [Erwinia phage pEa_SNUABM_13]|nr:hypothetical protein pEaSNUABM13_00019 [Erwinia phage pEa_SNUABM_13]
MKVNGRILAIVPHKTMQDRTKSGVGSYIDGLEAYGFCDFITDGENSSVTKSQWFTYGDTTLSDGYKIGHIQSELLIALERLPYRAIICSTYEAIEACVSLGLPKIMPVYYRTHNSFLLTQDLKGLGAEKIHRALLQAKVTGLRILANCDSTAINLAERYKTPAHVAYNSFSVPDYNPPAKRVPQLLIICRYEKVKRTLFAARIAAASGLPVRVMTGSDRQARNWEKELAEAGVKEYTVVSGLSGKQKLEFIGACTVALSTASVESFANGVRESIPYCPTFIVQTSKYDWAKDYTRFCTADKHVHIRTVDRVSDQAVAEIGSEIAQTATTRYLTGPQRKQLLTAWAKQVDRGWSDFVQKAVVDDDGKPLRTELYQELIDKSEIDWSQTPTLMRTVNALHKCHARLGLTFDGTKIKYKRKRK